MSISFHKPNIEGNHHLYYGYKAPSQRRWRNPREIIINALYKSRQLTKAALAKKLGISRPTLDKLIKDYENAENGG